MAQIGKVEVQTEMKSGGDKYYGFFKKNMSRIPQIFPGRVLSFEFLQGNDIRAGSVTRWKYVLVPGSSPSSAKAKIIAVDDQNKSITFEVVEGDVLNFYKTFKAKFQVTKASDGVGYVKWCIEFEKAEESAPSPDAYGEFALKLSKVLDDYLSEN